MGSDHDFNIINYGDDFTWEHVQEVLDREFAFRLPNANEAVYIDFNQQAIWISDMIGESHAVMDRDWGIQCIRSGKCGLILVEK
jgi:hypothetical protein